MFFYLFATVIVLYSFLSYKNKPKKECVPPGRYPRGPPALPLDEDNNLIVWPVGEPLHLLVSEWAREYGKIFTIYLHTKAMVVINDKNVEKDLCAVLEAEGEISSRYSMLLKTLCGSGDVADENEKFTPAELETHFIEAFGFGHKSYTDSTLLSETDRLCNFMERIIDEKSGEKMPVQELIFNSFSNFIWTIITGKILPDEQLHPPRIAHLFRKWSQAVDSTHSSNLFHVPNNKRQVPGPSNYEKIQDASFEIQKYVESLLIKYRESKKSEQPARKMLHVYIENIQSGREKVSALDPGYDWKQAYVSILMFLITSVDAIGDTLNWLLFYLSVHPDVQQKVQNEIDEVIGRHSTATFAHRKSMPYLELVILESLRFTFKSVSRLPTEGIVLKADLTFLDYWLPKGTILRSNLYNASNDRRIWGDPENFRPDRFMERGNERLREIVKTFEAGTTICPATSLNRDALFMYAVKLLQVYKFSVDENSENVQLSLRRVFSCRSKPEKVVYNVVPRF